MEQANQLPEPEEKRKSRALGIFEDLRNKRKVTDFRFDQVYPSKIRQQSEIQWTPVEVAIRATELLGGNEKTKVLDVGSGCGKFCTVAALTCSAHFFGVEQRIHLWKVAVNAAKELGASNASFIHGNMTEIDWSYFDAFYMYNPFYENKSDALRIDDTIPMGIDQFDRYVAITRTRLIAARPGTKVVTYHGYGGHMPPDFECLRSELIGSSQLELWVKQDVSTQS
ncbi:methyltransferase domain-containing protein [Bdellovibrionota bacterium FG-2]